MKNRAVAIGVAVSALVGSGVLESSLGVGSEAAAWSEATHAYIADHLGSKGYLRNLNEVYGAMAPDAFNFQFELLASPELAQCIRYYSHGYPLTGSQDFMTMWDNAGPGVVRYAAAAYVAHNDVWGMDSFAHWQSTGGTNPGYIVQKAHELVLQIDAQQDQFGQSLWDYLGIPPEPFLSPDPLSDPAELIAHFVIEKMGDVIIKREDPGIGLKLALASALRTRAFPALMVDVFGACTSDAGYIVATEAAFRSEVFERGLAMLGSEEQFIAAIYTGLVAAAPDYLEAMTGVPYDAALDPVVETLIESAMALALSAIEDDYMLEVGGVLEVLPARLAAAGVGY